MCLILFSWKVNPDYPLIMAANRDEFYNRPTTGVHWWEDHPELLGGRDLKAGGTWLGVTKSGKFAAVTNYRQFPLSGSYTTSRGALVKNFLLEDHTPENYFRILEQTGQEYEGFNLLFGDKDSLFYFSNRSAENGRLESGIYGLSNHLLDTPWPKVVRGKQAFAKLAEQSEQSAEPYFEVLHDQEEAADDELPDTGIGLQKEKWLSSLFIESPDYGTRSSTLLLLDKNDEFHLTEKGWIPSANNNFSFRIES